ncbi:MAG: M4 family metallopeptidase [Saprospiraceae bacterium]
MMKKAVLSFFLGLSCLSLGLAQTKVDRGVNVRPTFIDLNQKVNVFQKSTIFQQHLGMSNDDELRSVKIESDQLGFTHEKFQQYYNGVKVDGHSYTVHSRNGMISTLTGTYAEVEVLNTTPQLSPEAALQKALDHVGAQTYVWEGNGFLGMKGFERPTPELVVIADHLGRESSKLAYKMAIHATYPLYHSNVYVDAQTGAIIKEISKIHVADAVGTVATRYSGTQSVHTDSNAGSFRLRDYSRGNGVLTFDATTATSANGTTGVPNGSSEYIDNDNNWTAAEYNNADKDNAAFDAHFAAEATYDFFFSNFGRNSYNGSGAAINSYVNTDIEDVFNYPAGYNDNAFWTGYVMVYGKGNSLDPLTTSDITGHEIGHAFTEFTNNLVYQNESGAMNESLSDIWGACVENHININYGLNKDLWALGSETGATFRSMSNPNAYGDPDTYQGTNWYSGTGDNGGVHTNSGVGNHWFYILTEGKSGTNDIGTVYSVTGLGITKAAAITWRSASLYLSTNSVYADWRSTTIQAAVELYGAGSNEVIQTTNAWNAVGIGGKYGELSYCNSKGNNVSDEYIGRVQLGSIDNTSGSGGGYSNHTGISTDLAKNTAYTITITPTWTGTTYAEGYSVWIDYNKDGDFSDAGEQVYSRAATTATPVSGSFTVPSSATDGTTRMRVSMKYNGIPTACETFTYGEVEDYSVNITTGGGGDTQAPTAPSGLAASGTTQTSTNLTWTASTDNVGVTGYDVYVGGGLYGSTASTSLSVTGLTANTTYAIYVRAKDAAGNISGNSNTISVTTQAASDTQAPTAPTGLAASGTTQTTTNLSWNASTDNVGVTGYDVYVGGSLNGSTASTSYSVTGLTANTTYAIYVRAKDAAGNISGNSNTISVTTQSGGGTGSTTLTASYFETGWDGWADGGSDCARYAGSLSYEGTYSIQLRDNSGVASAMTSSSFNVSAYNQLDIEFYFYASSMEVGEDFWVRYYDGSTWNTIAAYARGTNFNNNTFYVATVTITSAQYFFPSNAQFRFQCDASANNDLIYIDAVTITASGGAAVLAGGGETIQTIQELGTSNSFAGFGEETELQEESLSVLVYPNPVLDELNLDINQPEKVVGMRVFAINGQLVKQVQLRNFDEVINVADLQSGMYFLCIETTDGVINKKFIKQ